MRAKVYFGMMMAVLLASVPAVAQVSDTDMLQQLRADIQTDRQALVAANLGLSDAEGEAFWPIYRQYRAEMGAVGDRNRITIELTQWYVRGIGMVKSVRRESADTGLLIAGEETQQLQRYH